MNLSYERYLEDDAFRSRLLENARRERAKAVARLFARVFRLPANEPRRDTFKSHLARPFASG